MVSTGSSSSGQEVDVQRAATAPIDIVIGLTSENDAATVGGVTRALREGLARSFAASAVHFVLADAGSTDHTREEARAATQPFPLTEVEFERDAAFGELPYHGQRNRPAALRAILRIAASFQARACVVIDARLPHVTPEWIERLVGPVINDGYDYVSPYHVRPVSEGAITRSIVYPVFRALYGVRLRQPAASDFGCSTRLVGHFLEQEFWEATEAHAGIDIWLAAVAVSGEFRACEAALGPRATVLRGTPADLSTTLAQLVGALFLDLQDRADVWQRVRGSSPVPLFGTTRGSEPDARPHNVDGLIESFRLGYRELRDIWTWVLPPRTIVELRKMTTVSRDSFRFDDRLWATIVYDFAVGYSLRALPHDHLLRSLTPLYTGWLASFVLQMEGATLSKIEARVEELCLAFELEKRHLISRWRWPERLR